MIAKEIEAEVLRLFHAEKWPVGTIAVQLGIHHTTVQRVLVQLGVARKAVVPRVSMVDPYVPFITEQLAKYPNLRASRLFRMVKERGYPGASDHFRTIVRGLRPRKQAEAFHRLRTLPGEQAQVDWAHFGKLQIGRASRPLWGFVMVLSYSRRLFLRFFPGASMPFFLQGHTDAFAHFGGVARVILYDNLKSAVLERRGDAIRFNPMLLELAAHYRFEPRPVAVARGNEKGRVERAIRYVREGFFEARPFADLADLNQQAIRWCETDALSRRWVEDRQRTVQDAFQEELPRLLSLPDNPFPAAQRVEVEVGKTPYARFDLNDYSVPHDRVGRTLTAFADLNTVRFNDANELVASHPRCWDRGQQIELPEHLARLTAEKRRAQLHRSLDRLTKATPAAQSFLRLVAARAGNVALTTKQLIALLDTVGALELNETLVEATKRDAIHVGALKQIIDRRRSARSLPPPLSVPISSSEHASLVVIPHSLATYDALKQGIDDE